MTREEIAWAAGLFEGEGSISRGCRRRLQLKMTDEAVVKRFHDVVQCGKVYGPYQYEHKDGYKRSPVWVWVARGIDAVGLLASLWPWLSDYRQARAVEVFGDMAGDAFPHENGHKRQRRAS